MDTEEFEVLETMMFERPPEWGRRVIKKSDGEVMLQTTEDKGKTWQDAPIPDVKLSLPTAITRSISGNSYAGLVLTPRDAMLTRAVAASTKELKSEVVEAIDSGQLITKTTDDTGIETVTFLSTYAASGLSSGSVWRDANNYLRIVP